MKVFDSKNSGMDKCCMKEYKETTGQLLFSSRKARTQKYCTKFGKTYLKSYSFDTNKNFEN